MAARRATSRRLSRRVWGGNRRIAVAAMVGPLPVNRARSSWPTQANCKSNQDVRVRGSITDRAPISHRSEIYEQLVNYRSWRQQGSSSQLPAGRRQDRSVGCDCCRIAIGTGDNSTEPQQALGALRIRHRCGGPRRKVLGTGGRPAREQGGEASSRPPVLAPRTIDRPGRGAAGSGSAGASRPT